MQSKGRYTLVNVLDFSTPRVPFQNLNEGERVFNGTDLAGEQTDELCKCDSESGMIHKDKIASLVVMILGAAVKIVRHGAPVFHRLVIHLEAPIFNNLDVIRSPMKWGVNNILKLTYLL